MWRTLQRCPAIRIVAVAALALPAIASAGEFKDHCANGLANYDAMVETDCSVNWKDPATGRTYCFSSGKSRIEFLRSPEANIKKAQAAFDKLKDE